MKLRVTPSSLALAALVMGSAPAYAKPPTSSLDCNASGTEGYIACIGSLSVNPGHLANEALSTLGLSSNTLSFSSASFADAGNPFAADPGSANAGRITFDHAQTGVFWIALVSGSQASYYEFNGGSGGISSFSFDTLGTAAVTTGGPHSRTFGKPLSDAFFFGTPSLQPAPVSPTPVPEPETYAMFLAGLAAFGYVAYRRKLN
jgi:hypothetical protein